MLNPENLLYQGTCCGEGSGVTRSGSVCYFHTETEEFAKSGYARYIWGNHCTLDLAQATRRLSCAQYSLTVNEPGLRNSHALVLKTQDGDDSC